MTTMTIELDDELAQKVKARAKKSGQAPEAWLRASLAEQLNAAEPEELSDDEFRALARSVIEDNRELLERLAR